MMGGGRQALQGLLSLAHLSVIWGRKGGVEETEARSPPSSVSSSLEFWIRSASSSWPCSF